MASVSESRGHPRADSSFVCEECAAASTKLGSLNTALEDGHHTCLEALLKSGAVNDMGWLDEALMEAFLYEESECMEVLIAAGANVNHQDVEGTTALIHAALDGNNEIVEFLLKSGAEVNTKNKKGWTALFLAATQDHDECVKTLIHAGADLNCKDWGYTALTMAVHSGCGKSMKVLISAGVDVNLQDKAGLTALMIESGRSGRDTCKYARALIKAGADINLRDNGGSTALIKAVLKGNDNTVKILVQKGADVNLRNNNGITALMVAKGLGHEECVKILTQLKSYPKTLRLEHLCRISIRKHLLQTSKMNLFDAVPKLGIPHLSEFLLFSDIFHEDEIKDEDVPSS